MTCGCEETKIGWEWRKLRGEMLTVEGKEKGGGQRNRLGGDRKGAFNSPQLFTHGCSTTLGSRSPRLKQVPRPPRQPFLASKVRFFRARRCTSYPGNALNHAASAHHAGRRNQKLSALQTSW